MATVLKVPHRFQIKLSALDQISASKFQKSFRRQQCSFDCLGLAWSWDSCEPLASLVEPILIRQGHDQIVREHSIIGIRLQSSPSEILSEMKVFFGN
jgi:hypothetical protein